MIWISAQSPPYMGDMRSSWVIYLSMFGVYDMGFPHEKAKGKRPPVKKDKMPYGKGPKKD